MKLVLGSDHAGFNLKQTLLPILERKGHVITDVGSFDPDPVDFPDIARKVAKAITDHAVDRALIVCGTGVGAAIAANKVAGIRAAVCHDVHSARQAVEHDDVNVMCLGAQIVGQWLAADLVEAFLNAEFVATPDHRRRVALIAEMETPKHRS